MSFAALMVLASLVPVPPQEPDPLAGALTRAGDNRPQIERALAEVPPAQRPSLAFLVEHMPEPDLRALTAGFLLTNVALAHAALEAAPWRAQLPADVFRDFVLPYAQIDETREAWRADLRARSPCVLCESLRCRGDPVLAASCEVVVRAP
jgi:hypothetical protein